MSEYILDGSVLTYQIESNGYLILKDNEPWISQYEPFIPDKSKSYEANAIAQIEELIKNSEESKKEQATIEDLQQQVTDLQLALAELVEGGEI